MQRSETIPTPSPTVVIPQVETAMPQRLAHQRLGVHTGLFYALRAKHPPTAAHCLRVALAASKWAEWRGMAEDPQSLLEVASLLHDLGKLGVPDQILQKPQLLDQDEKLVMRSQLQFLQEILRASGAGNELLNVILLSRQPLEQQDEASPDFLLAGRMLQILDAYDSMTNEQPFRRAFSSERAVAVLMEQSGQFCSQLVDDFAELICEPRADLEQAVAKRWLFELQDAVGFEEKSLSALPRLGALGVDQLFHRRLLGGLPEAAIYLDSSDRIVQWSKGAERLTGKHAQTMLNQSWGMELLGLVSQEGEAVPESDCPVRRSKASNTLVAQKLSVPGEQRKMVHVTAMPVISNNSAVCGTIVLIEDISNEACLEEQLQSLNNIAAMDALTKVANRAELDRQLPEFLEHHAEHQEPGSMIICDIDFFKRINDRYGHQAGDDALITFAGLLREGARSDDLVARYGGEEFIILCAQCDTRSAVARAEEIRKLVEQTPVPSLADTCITSSFGVTEIQTGDSTRTFLARADRALLMAKQGGRNRVVEIGVGQSDGSPVMEQTVPEREAKGNSWLSWFGRNQQSILSHDLLFVGGSEMLNRKLEGFISDHGAQVQSTGSGAIVIRATGIPVRRSNERPTAMLIRLENQPVHTVQSNREGGQSYQPSIQICVSILPVRSRDRRSDSLKGQAQHLLSSLKSYLLAQDVDSDLQERIIPAR